MENVAINHVIKKLMIDCNLKREDIDEILDQAKQKKISFITCLMQTKKIESLYLAKLLAKEFFLDYFDLDTLDTLQIPCHLLDKTLQQRFKILPLSQDKKN
ncbi:hypothetical protein BEV13_01705 [Rickettsiella grylli]|uniref:hypothetical protein n=1 Tax=Rickettsiella grylli TaxID=59196 RepID=UPI0008FD70C3|nr:hypothetical protein [Rickettsiella grylli]OJA00946.1 hypothetical protein BEV13_01705 [Rickettsiella grylli]